MSIVMSRALNRAWAIPLAFVIGVLALWQGLVVGLAIPEYLLPAPLVIVETLDRSLLTEIAYTAGEALCGFVIASGLAFAAAIAFVRFRTMRADPAQIFRKLRIPYCLPYFFSALKISSSLAIVGAIVGEFVGAEHGLGYLIVISSAHLETPTVFQAIGAAALIGIAMFYLLEWVEKRVVFWAQVELE